MDKILFFDKRYDFDSASWLKEAKELKVDLISAHYDDLLFHFSTGESAIFVRNQSLASFSTIFFYTRIGYEEEVVMTSIFSKLNKINVVDQVLPSRSSYIDSKSYEYMILSNNSVPIIETWAFRASGYYKHDLSALSFPMVVKVSDAERGEGVFLVKSLGELEAIINKCKNKFLLLQPYVENDGDVRVLVIGGKAVATVKRKRKDDSDFRNNVSQGASISAFNLDEKGIEVAITAAEALQYDFAGVDLIYDSNAKEYVVMEVNRSPQFIGTEQATGVNVRRELLKYLNFL